MPNFQYLAINSEGVKEKGQISAETSEIAKYQLKEKNLIPIKLQTRKSNFSLFKFSEKKLSVSDLSLLTRQLSVLSSGGVPLDKSLKIISEQASNSVMKEQSFVLATKIEEGFSLSEALKEFPKSFDHLYVALITAGETSGEFNVLLEKISLILDELNLSNDNANKLLVIKKKLMADKTKDSVLKHFLDIFDVIVSEFKDEQNNAKSFLSSLSDTLTNVQLSVKETLDTQKNSQVTNDKINIVLQKQLIDMTGTVEKASSLDQIKLDISQKLQQLAGTLEQKSRVELQSQLDLTNKLAKMAERVAQFEDKSKQYKENN